MKQLSKIYILPILVAVLMGGVSYRVGATHIVGGEMRYESLGDGLYRIILSMRRDCYNGAPNAQFDKLAGLGVYDGDGNLIRQFGLNGSMFMIFSPDDTLNEYVNSECKVIGEDVCVHTTSYTTLKSGDRIISGVVRLPYRKGGYYIGYQRCCRNKIVNITDPEGVGATYFVRITEDALLRGNNSAKFKEWAPIYLCAGRPFVFDQSATDVDGDSLVYRICTPYQGGSRSEQKPVPPPSPRGWELINWKPPYSLNNLLGGVPLRIDPVTGRMTCTPKETGTYLVGVCIEEYRNGKLINTVRREFEFNVRLCPEKPNAEFEVDSVICHGLTVDFTNTSSDGQYQWYFDADNDQSLGSTEKNPSHTYDHPGTYRVVLVTVRDSTCIDSFNRTIYIYGEGGYGADFDYGVNSCDDSVEIEFFSTSFDKKSAIADNQLQWIIKGGTGVSRATGRSVIYKHPISDTLEVTLLLTTANGCMDSITKRIPVNVIDVDFRANNIAICHGDSAILVDTVHPQFTYFWTPSDGLSCSDCPNPKASPTMTTTYKVVVADSNCSVTREVTVKVNDLLDIDVLGDSIACSRQVHLFTNGGVEQTVQWASDRAFKNLLSEGTYELDFTIEGVDTMIYVRAESESGCPGLDSILVINEIIDLEYEKRYHVCVGDTFSVSVTNRLARHQLVYDWTPDASIVSGQGSDKPLVVFNKPGQYQLNFVATNQYGCTSEGAIVVDVEDLPDVAFDFSHSCEDLVVEFMNLSDTGKYFWDFGDGTVDTTLSPTHTFPKQGTYKVRLRVEGFCMDSLVQMVQVGFIEERPNDTIISCFARPVHLYPDANTQFQYQWTPGEYLDDPTLPNPLATVDSTTRFMVTITNSDFPECFVTREVLVVVPPAIEFTLTKDTILCYTDSLQLRVQSGMRLSYEWRDDQGILIGNKDSLWVRVEGPTTYYVIATDTFGCFVRDSVVVTPYFIDVDIDGPDFLCFNNEGMIQVVNNGEGTFEYHWTPEDKIIAGQGNSKVTVRPDTTTTFKVELTNELGCRYERSFTVVVSKVMPQPIATADPDTIYLKQSSQLEVNDIYESYEWIPDESLSCSNCPDPIATPEMTTTYKVYVTNEDGCVDSAFVTVVVILPKCNEEDVYVPNAFSPNGDGENDVWQVLSNFVEEIEVIVYDRWGEEIFKSNALNASWDGTYKGEHLAPDVYGYRIAVKCVDGQEYVKSGNITLLR